MQYALGGHRFRCQDLTLFIKLTDMQFDMFKVLPDKFIDLINQMNDSIDRDLTTIKHAVNGSKSEDDLVTCDAKRCIERAIENYPFENDEKVLIVWQKAEYFQFLGNPVLFYRIIFNLIKNALYQIKQKGKGQTFISTEAGDECNIIRFKDTAGGVTPELVTALFQGFNTTKEEGTGVGLAFCRFTMRSFGGDITAHCVEGDCIEFVLKFPKY